MNQCKWCCEFFDLKDKSKGWMANHTRWCEKNPKRKDYIEKFNKIRNNITQVSIEKIKLGVSQAHKQGKYKQTDFGKYWRGKNHSFGSKEIMRKKALQSKHRRLKKGIIDYKGIMLDSSWELELAKRLDQLEIQWERPKPLKWIDKNGIKHNYFPDFYLVKYNLYLDPKNPAAYQNQKEKIEVLKKTYNNLKFILTLDECRFFEI
jgi:hypothetical protein